MIVVCSPKFSKLESEASRSRSVPHQQPEATCVHFEHDKRGPRGSSCWKKVYQNEVAGRVHTP